MGVSAVVNESNLFALQEVGTQSKEDLPQYLTGNEIRVARFIKLRPMRLAWIIDQCGMPHGVAQEITQNLISAGYISFDEENGEYADTGQLTAYEQHKTQFPR